MQIKQPIRQPIKRKIIFGEPPEPLPTPSDKNAISTEQGFYVLQENGSLILLENDND